MGKKILKNQFKLIIALFVLFSTLFNLPSIITRDVLKVSDSDVGVVHAAVVDYTTMTWDIPEDADGEGLGTTITVPIDGTAYINWGDGEEEWTTTSFPTHNYSEAGVYTIYISIGENSENYAFGYNGAGIPTKTNIYSKYYSFTEYFVGVDYIGDEGLFEFIGFSNCKQLSYIEAEGLQLSFENFDMTNFDYYFYNCESLQDINLPNMGWEGDTSKTFYSAFEGCTSITNAEINVTNISSRMFYGCNNLKNITIGNDVQTIATDAFEATAPYNGANYLKTVLTTENDVALAYNWAADNRALSSNTITFVGDNFTIQDNNGNIATSPITAANGEAYFCNIVPKYGYGITDITCTNSTGDVAIEVSGYIMNKLVKVPEVTEDLTITVTTVAAPVITVQPVSVKATIGGTAKYTITAENATSYQWQYRDVGNTYWTNASTSQTLSVTPAASMAGRQYRCLVGNANFTEHVRVPSDIVYIIPTDDEITETAIISNASTTEILPPKITVQPVSVKAKINSTAKFTIKAENATKYQWQYRDSKDVYWTNLSSSSSTSGTATLSVTAAYSTSGREYRCLVGNANYPDHSRAKSDIFALIVADDEITEPVTVWDLEITKQPESQKVKFGETATFAVETVGNNTYKWQYKTSNASGDWIDVDANIGTSNAIASDFTTNALKIDTSKMTFNKDTLDVTNNISNYVFRCLVNSTVYTPAQKASDAAFLSVAQDEYAIENIKTKTPATLNIIDSALVGTDDTTEVDIEYNGDGELSASSNNEAVVTAEVSDKKLLLTGVSEGSATVTLNAASGTTYGPATATIDVQVLSVEKVTFIGSNFKVQDNNGNTLTSPVSAESGKPFQFVIIPDEGYGITDVTCTNGAGETPVNVSGDSIFSVVGTVKAKAGMVSAVNEDLTVTVTSVLAPEVTTQPLTEKVKVGDTVTFTVAANNATTYQWQYRDGRDDYWKDVPTTMASSSSSTTASYTSTAIDYNWAGYEFRCLVGNDNFTGDERVTTDIVALSVASDDIVIGETPVILEQPNMDNAKVEANTGKATFSVTALGKDLTFTWQYRENRDTYWKTMVSSVGSATTTTVSTDPGFPTAKSTLQTATAIYSMAGYEFRCLVGNEFYKDDDAVKSDIVAISVADDDISIQVQVQDLGIAKQPESQKVAIGETATFTIEKTETSTINTYKWQYKENESDDFWLDVDANMGKDTTVASGFNTATLTINTSCMSINEETLEVTNNLSGYLFRCVVSNSSLPTVTKNSDMAVLSVGQDDIVIDNIQIMKEPTINVPETIMVGVGETKTYDIAYVGDGNLTITSGDSIYATSSLEGNTLTVVGVAEGTATITLEASKGTEYAGKTFTVNVEVENLAKYLITEWTIPADADGTLEAEGVAKTTIILPIPSATTNAYTVDWGDGTTSIYDSTADFPTHTYTNTEETVYTIKIKGKVHSFGYYYISGVPSANYNTFKQYLTRLIQWGELEVTRYSFSDCKNLGGTIPSPTENSFINVTTCESLFASCSKLTGSIPKNLFTNAPNVTSFASTFGSCSGLTGSIPGELFTNTPLVTGFRSTFGSCSGLTGSIPGELFENTPLVTSFAYTFDNCSGLTGSIPGELFANTPSVTSFYCTFEFCKGLTGNIPEKLFEKTEKVRDYNSTFKCCSGLTGEIPGELFKKTKEVTTFDYIFMDCSGLTGEIPGELFTNTPLVKSFYMTFYGCSNLTGAIPATLFSNTKLVEGQGFGHTFKGCSKITSIPKELFANTPLVTSFVNTFEGCSGLTTIPKELFANTPLVTIFTGTFKFCSGLIAIPKELFANTPNVKNFSETFRFCSSLTEVPEGLFANNTGINVSGYAQTFYGCTGLTSAVIDSKYIGNQMFYLCNNLTDITITDNVESIYGTGSFKANSPYSTTNLLPTKLTSTNPVALSYDWAADYRYIDATAPTATFTPNGNTTYEKSQSITITLTEEGSGLDNTSLKYLWTQSTTAPTEDEFIASGTSFANGETITKDGVSGNDWYLWILAKDTIGNIAITNTNAFYLDNEKPEITISSSEVEFGGSMSITLGDTLSGVTGWQITETNEEPTTWNEIASTESTTITYTPNRAGVHFVWTKDSVGNVSLAQQFTVSGQDLSGATVTLNPETFTYDGYAKEPEVTVVLNETPLTKDEDYTVRYENNIEVGTATVIIEGKDNYKGTITVNFTIEKEIYDDILVDKTAPIITDIVGTRKDVITVTAIITDPDITDDINSEVIPGVGVNEAATRYALTLTDEKPAADSDVWQESNEFAIPKAKMAYMWVKAEDNVGNIAIEGSSIIVSVSINTLDIKTSPSSFVYDGTEKTLTVVIKEDDYTLVEGTDYELSYEENKNVGTATLTITGLDMYSDTKVINFVITQRDLIVTPNINQNIIFGAAEPKLTYTYTGNVDGEEPGFDGTLSRAAGTDVGTYAITLGTLTLKDNDKFLKDNYNLIFNGNGITFEIKQKSLSGATVVLDEDVFTYDGKEKKPTPTVVVDGKPLTPGKDYTISYDNNTNVGAADDETVENRPVVTITGTGNYEGTIDTYFTIDPATLSVTLGDYTSEYDGLAHSITVTAPADSVVTYSEDGVTYNETAPTYTDVSVNTVYVKVEKANYTTYTGNAVVTINKKAVTVDWPDNLTLDYNGAEQVPSVPTIAGANGEVITLTVDGAKSAVGGPYTATASIASVSGANGKASNYDLTNPTAAFYITNDNISISATLDSNSFVYDGTAKTPTVTVTTIIDGETVTLEEGKDFDVKHDETKDVGTKTVTITGKGDYAGKGTSVTFEITKKDLVVTPKDNQSMIYGETEPKLDYTYSGNVSGEEPGFTGALSREEGDNKGTYEITEGTLALQDKENFLANNYNLVFNGNGVTFEITQRDISSMQISLDKATFVYDGTYHTPNAVIVLNGNNLVKDTDFEITYVNNKHVGQATATVKGIGNFNGSKQVTFTITEKALTVNWTNTTLEYVNGLSQAPTATVNTEVDGESITLAVKGAKESVGTGYIAELDLANSTITGTDSKLTNYTFSPNSTTFSIVLPEGSDFVINYTDTVANGVYTYDGTAKEPGVKVTTVSGVVLAEGTDYTVDYTNNIDAGTETSKPTITVTGINNYDGVNATKVFTINKKQVAVVWGDTELEYVKGLSQAPTATATGVNGETINLVITGAQINVGTGYTATIDLAATTVTGGRENLDNYSLSPVTTTFDIVLPEGSNFVVNFTDTVANGVYTYDGTAKEPGVKVTTESGIELTAGTDYTVNYTNNIDAGTESSKPTITVTGINNYDGVNASKEFTINKKSVAVVWGDTELEYVKGLSQAPTATATGVNGETINLVITGAQINVGTGYTATIDLAATTVTGGRAKLDNYTLTNTSTTFDIVLPEGSDFVINFTDTVANGVYTYDGTAKEPEVKVTTESGIELTLGTDYTVSYSNNIDAGTESIKPTITVTGINNYDGVNGSKEFTINKKQVAVVWGDTELEYVKGLSQAPTATATGVNGETINLVITGAKENVGTDYTASVDLAATTVTGGRAKLDNYTLTNTSTTFDIVLPEGSDFVINYTDTVANGVYTYDGTAKEPEIIVTTASGIELTLGTDYTVSYTNNIDAGTETSKPTITVTGINNYDGVNASKEFTINKKQVAVVWGDTELEYVKGLSQAPIATATGVNGETINLVITGAQINVGTGYTATIDLAATTVTGGRENLDNYSLSPVTTTFDIALPEGSDFVINFTDTVANGVYTYDGIAKEPGVKVTTESGIELTVGEDYTVGYSNNIDAGTESIKPTITVTGINNYDGVNASKEFTINKKAVNVVWTNTLLEFNNKPQKPTATATGVDGETINLVITGEQTNVGRDYTASIDVAATTVTGGRANLGNYLLTNTSTTFEIKVPNVEFNPTLDNNVFDYNGDPKEPSVTVKVTINGEEITLEEGKDYEVTYEDNTEPGTGKVIITGKDNYEGIDTEVEFTINKIEREVSVIMNSYDYAGTLPTPTLSNNDEPGTTVFYVNTVDSVDGAFAWSTVTDSKYLDAGTYYMYATITETAHYKAKTTAIVTFEVYEATAVHPTVENKVYNGKTQVGVYGGQGIIISGVTEAINVGTYTAYGTLEDNYKWPDGNSGNEYVWTISPLNINDVDVALDKYAFFYDGTAKEPKAIVSLDGTVLKKDKDYTVTYENNIEIGTAKAIITGINNFEGSIIKEFTIKELQLEKIELDNTEFTYIGDEIKPKERVYDTEGNVLMRDRDYTLYYVNNIQVGTATIGAIGKGNYRGTVETTFEIVGNILTNAEITLSGFPFVYDGTEKRPGVTVVFEGNTLANGRDYVLEYNNNIDAGENTANVTITGIGKYAGSIEKYFTIMKADRKASIVPGKAILLGEKGNLDFSYDGEIGDITVIVDDSTIASVADKEYSSSDWLELTGLKVGKSTIKVTIAATNNYNETVLNTEVTVFENIESAYPIYGTVVINDNDEFTISPRTLLTLNVDFGDYMYISESNVAPTVDNPEWYEFSTKMPYVFDDVEGEKTIYVWFKDKNGNISEMATDSIILDYDADTEAKDNTLLDQTEIDKTAPDVETHEYHNDSVDVKVTFNQMDVMVNGVRSGVDHATIKHGYKETGSTSDYTWQDSPIFTGLKYNTPYTFVTQASDRAGNGPTISDEKLMRTERKYNITITLEDKNAQYNGDIQNIDEAVYTLVNDTPITGTLTYTYYIDKDCTIVTTPARDGSEANGGAPSLPGNYYVKVTLTGDAVYYDTESNVANLRIGWEISKTEDDNVFAYLERVDENSDEFILHISGEGNMADLDELLANNSNNPDSYWTDYKDNITSLDIGNTSEDNITNIGSEMFSDLTKITDIVIQDTVISIGDYAFEGCTSVTEVIEVPVSVEEIGAGAFKDVNTPAFEVLFGSTTFDTIDGVLTDTEHKELIAYPNGKTDIKYEVPETITTIKESAFSGADKIRDVVIPNGVEVIEGKAFYECTNLEKVEIEDLMSGDIIVDLDSIGGKAFDSIAKDSVIYTFSEEVAKMFTAGTTHNGEDTKVYWPPVITLDPIDMNGAVGYKVKFIIDTKAGNPEETKYQWFKVEGDTATLIPGATNKEYTTDSLTTADDNTYYYCIAYNDDYYYDRGYVSSQRAKLTMLDSANYMVERGTYNTYLFETLQDAFNFAENDDVIKPLKTVDNEADAVLSDNKSIMIDLNTNTINLTGKISIDSGSKVELVGDGAITKSGGYIFENKGELVLNGEFDLINNTGFGIKSLEDSKLTYTAGNITVASNAIYAENATVNINGANANIVASTSNANANAISLHGTTTFDMSAGNVSIGYKAEPTSGNISGIYVAGETSGAVNISGGTIKATATVCNADAIVNAGASDVRITGTANIVGTRSGIMTSNTNTYGDIYVQGGTITGGTFGILNNANGAKVVIGTEGKGVIVTSPVIVGEKVAIFNTKENNTLEMYDGILYSHGIHVIYEELNNTNLSISDTITEHIYSEEGRAEIKTENDYFLVAEENVSYNSSTYTAVHLEQYKAPTIGVDVKDQTVEVGEKATFEIVVSGGIPAVYEYQWQVSRDGGITWTNVTVGTGANTSKYTTPIASITMDGYKYRCLVTNGKKDIISRAAALTVVEKVEIGDLRPVVRFEFTNGRVVANEMIDGKETKVVNMQVIVKSFSELQTLVINGTNILGQKEYNFTDGSIRLAAYSPDGVDYGPIKITKVINDKEEIVEYTYTYNMKVLVNGVITAEVLDVQGRDNSATQIVDLLYDLKVDYYKTDVSKTNKNVTVVFFANKPVKPIKSITSSYINSKYLDLISVDKKEYSYRYTLELDGPLSETVFWFEDEFKNQAYVTVEEILRVEYKDIKFGMDTIAIDDLTVIDAFNMAQELETVTEVNSNEELQARYGLNSVQSDMFMSRARDLGALSILSNATVAKSYDGVFIDKIEATVGSKESVYDPVAETTNLYVAAAAKDRVENELTSKNRKYVDIITKDVSLYKGMNISDFVIDDKAPYMYTINDKVSNITSTTIAEAGFRATIIPK